MEEEFQRFMDSVSKKLDSFDRRIQEGIECVQRDTLNSRSSPALADLSDQTQRSSHVAPGTACATGTSDIQGDFAALRDSLSRIKLPAELKLNESRQGIRRSDQPVLNILTKCSRYSETSARLLSTIEPGQPVTQETLDSLFLISHAQSKYLQDEYAALVVNSQFDNSTSRLFRALQKNTSGLNTDSLETLRSAATLAAASRQPRGNDRGRGSGRSRGSDVFSRFSQRGFPQRRYNRDDNSTTVSAKDD